MYCDEKKFLSAKHKGDVPNDSILCTRVRALLIDFVDRCDDKFLINLARQWLSLLPERDETIGDISAYREVAEKIRKDHQITRYPIHTYILKISKDDDATTFQTMLLLLGRHYATGSEGRFARVVRSFNSYRIILNEMSDKSRGIKSITNALPMMAKTLFDAHNKIFEICSHERGTPQAERLLPVRLIVKDVYHNTVTTPRSPGERSHNSDTSSEPLRIATTHDETQFEPGYIETTLIPAQKPDDIHTREYQSDNRSDETYVEITPEKSTPSWVLQSRELLAVKFDVANQSIEKREKNLRCQFSTVLHSDIKILVGSILANQLPNSVSLYLWLLLLTGRDEFDVNRARRVRSVDGFRAKFGNLYTWDNGRLIWLFKPELPEHYEYKRHGDRFLVTEQSAIQMILPQGLISGPPKIHISESAIALSKQWVSELNHSENTDLTLHRISGYLSQWLSYQGVDDAEISLLTGSSAKLEPGIYYLRYNINKISKIYQRYLNNIFPPDTVGIEIYHPVGEGGTCISPTDHEVSAVFREQYKRVSRSASNVIEFHNQYTAYVVMLMNFATGHRPVSSPFDNWSRFDLENGRVIISDKEIRTASAERTLILPELALRQMRLYRDYLEMMERLFIDIGILGIEFFKNISTSRYPLFFILDSKSGLPEPVSPKTINKIVFPGSRVPANWYRHYIRTLLNRREQSSDVINTWMGHARPGQEGYSRYSGMSMSQLRSVADEINQKMIDLGIVPFEVKHL